MASSDYSSGSRFQRQRSSPGQRGRKRTVWGGKGQNSPSRNSGSTPLRKSSVDLPFVAYPRKRDLSAPVRADRRRLILVWLLILGGIVGLSLNLFRLQIGQESSFLKAQALSQQQQKILPFVPRRSITDHKGDILALDQRVYTLYVHPKLFKQTPNEIAEKLAPVLLREDSTTPLKSELLTLFGTSPSGIKVADSISEQVANHIQNLGLDGLELLESRQRLYPQQENTSDVVGHVNLEGKGQAGIEYSQENLLERTMPSLSFQRAANGAWVPERIATGFIPIDDLELRLTIDSSLQRVAHQALQKSLKEYKAKRGTVIVMDATDGSVLTLANEPTYNPNQYYKFDLERFKNWALTDLYEPGSTFKPINIALALEAGAIQPDTVVNDEGHIQVGGWPIQNYDGSARGEINISDVVKYSSNVGMVRIMQRMEPEVFYEGLKRLGLGTTMGIDLPFAATSTLKSKEQFVSAPIEPATTAFGQGFSITPIQLAQLHSLLANGGKLVTPHVVQGLYNSKSQLYWKLPLSEPQQVFSSETANSVLKMMETVVKEGGTGTQAAIENYRVAGKTGTAQKASADGGYSPNALITSFVGILSVDHPRYVVVAVVDEPLEGRVGGIVAAPIVKSVMEALIHLEKLPPSDIPVDQSQINSYTDN
ncbi:MAG: penicillin-binding protein 2 [Planktothrix agardhii LY1]|uniref:peptidoglycan D,D-transpeptidase FtsI family protein n=1 Tax=Planktothrix agardhii TaxID=1160 RepID=UPI002431BB83|nr:penicillin-binding protein 2 [Planktothrix agardhii]MCP9297143.1 penicillin-binding protein 2 [Planktothrix agardhii LY1]MEA5560025.1 penicillin-binding protein 2 [Planktothrix agardhii UHCC 0887]